MRRRPHAYVVHQTERRLRLKIPTMRGDQHYFTAVQRALAKRPGVGSVEVMAVTASVLIRHDGGLDLDSLRNPLFDIGVAPAPRASPRRVAISSAAIKLDHHVRAFLGKDAGLLVLIWRLARAAAGGRLASHLIELAAGAILRAILRSRRLATLPRRRPVAVLLRFQAA